MDIRDYDENAFQDIFKPKDQTGQQDDQQRQGVNFGRGNDDQLQDLFKPKADDSASGETTQPPSATGETTETPSATGETTEKPAEGADTDILKDTNPQKGQ